jgi:single-stranded DNA-binding protein
VTPLKSNAPPLDDLNEWTGSGEVIGAVRCAKTGAGVDAASFWIRSAKHQRSVPARFKINVYGKLAADPFLRDLLPGTPVYISGELMNRTFDNQLSIEIRARTVTVIPPRELLTTAESPAVDAEDRQPDDITTHSDLAEPAPSHR